jgi:hypothetical protein
MAFMSYEVELIQNHMTQKPLLWVEVGAHAVRKRSECSGVVSAGVSSRRGCRELELIQTHMTQKPLLWVEVGAHAVRKRSECAGVVWLGVDVAWRLSVVLMPLWAVWRRQLSL